MLKSLNWILGGLFFFAAIPGSSAQENEAACLSGEKSHAVDFWLGNWRVTDVSGETHYGTNLVERALKGCAIFENWASAGGEGKSLFYYDARDDSWTQVWVTEDTSQAGGLKIKHLIEIFDDGSARFQGTIQSAEYGTYLDRTTLTPNEDGTVRQRIEVSMDEGANWRTTFDAIYHPVAD